MDLQRLRRSQNQVRLYCPQRLNTPLDTARKKVLTSYINYFLKITPNQVLIRCNNLALSV